MKLKTSEKNYIQRYIYRFLENIYKLYICLLDYIEYVFVMNI